MALPAPSMPSQVSLASETEVWTVLVLTTENFNLMCHLASPIEDQESHMVHQPSICVTHQSFNNRWMGELLS
jgi:hypothetical protein